MTEDAYASAIFLLLKAKVYDLAGDEYRNSVLESIKEWIQAVPLQFLHELLDYLGDFISYCSPPSAKSSLTPCPSSGDKPSERIIRWQLRLEYFAYDTLQDLRIAKLFKIIVDYPDRSSAYKSCTESVPCTWMRSCRHESSRNEKDLNMFVRGSRSVQMYEEFFKPCAAGLLLNNMQSCEEVGMR